jgi:predicted unusual protein kinase regulating ubiquinone biosynthesis (AarF/ABC1/UbiB family)
MASKWEKLGGERGQAVDTSRLGRAFKLGKVATRFAGSVLSSTFGKHTEEEKAEALAQAAMRNADRIVDVMGQMKGAAMKIGQLLSSDPDIVAPEFADHLAKLQQEAPPLEFKTIVSQIESALDQPMSALFRFFDPEPLGSASIGQVHRGTLLDGREVAVKVQYPGIAKSLDSDLKNLGSLLTMGRVFMTKDKAEGFLDEARRAILQETDYLAEAQNLVKFRALFADWPDVRIPEPYLEFCRPTVLVMQFLEGRKLDDALIAMEDREKRAQIATRFVEMYVYMVHQLHLLHADPHPGNFMLAPDGALIVLDFGCVKAFDPRMAEGIMDLLAAFWRDDWHAMEHHFRRLGFGKEGGSFPPHDVMRSYHHMILEPLLVNQPFHMGQWKMHARARQFVLKNMSMVRLIPPPELLMYLRVIAGMKGMLTKADVAVNIRAIAERECRRQGKLPPPKSE